MGWCDDVFNKKYNKLIKIKKIFTMKNYTVRLKI